MEREVVVVGDAEFERLGRQWGYDLEGLSAERIKKGMKPPQIESICHPACGVMWIIMRQSRWDEIQEMEATKENEE